MRLIDADDLKWSMTINENGRQLFFVSAENIHNAPTASDVRWIPVTERLPEENDADARGYVLAISRWDGCINSHAHHAVSRVPNAFTHWMPLPEPPKESAE